MLNAMCKLQYANCMKIASWNLQYYSWFKQLISYKKNLAYGKYCPRNLALNFGPNRFSNNWDIPVMDKFRRDKCCLDKCHHDSWNLFKMVPGSQLLTSVPGRIAVFTLMRKQGRFLMRNNQSSSMRNVSCFLVRNLGRFLIVKSQPNLNTFNQLTTFPKVGFVDLILRHHHHPSYPYLGYCIR